MFIMWKFCTVLRVNYNTLKAYHINCYIISITITHAFYRFYVIPSAWWTGGAFWRMDVLRDVQWKCLIGHVMLLPRDALHNHGLGIGVFANDRHLAPHRLCGGKMSFTGTRARYCVETAKHNISWDFFTVFLVFLTRMRYIKLCHV